VSIRASARRAAALLEHLMTAVALNTPRPPAGSGADDAVLGAATVTTGLLAGLYYAYACSVMVALAKSDDRTFIQVMQRINRAIENPAFFASFFGAPLLTAIAVSRWHREPAVSRWTTAALALHAVAFVVTAGVNLPLNNELANAGDPTTMPAPAAVRGRFEDRWLAWNVVRTVATTGALAALAGSLPRAHRRSGPPPATAS
jgi:uncharacterized membrane protein